MCKIVAFLGSPRKNGYTNQLINKIIDGAKSTGSEIVVYDLNAEGIRCCQGCFYCRDHEDCAIKDTLSPMYEDIKTADGIILGSPIYFGTVSSQVKIWLDRMYPMYAMDFSPRFPGKKAVSVFAQANPDSSRFTNAIETTNNFLKAYGWDVIESLLVYGDVADGYSIPAEVMDRAYEAGKQLGRNS